MATRRKRNLNFLPAESRTEPVIDISAYPVDIGVGELMRLTRERLGHELQTVANQLRIRLSYLEAIEDARFRDLPGTTYAVGFVRSYADYLGLDGADIVRRFREEAARIHGQTKLVFPALTAEGKLPRAAVLLVSAVGLAAIYGVWYYISSHQQSELPVITDVPDRLAALAPDSGSGADSGGPDRSPETPSTVPAPAETSADRAPTAGTGAANAATPPASNHAASGNPASDSPASDRQVRAPAGDHTDISTPSPVAPAVAAPTVVAPTADTAASSTDANPIPPAPAAAAGVQAPAVATANQPGAPASAAPPAAADGSTASAPAAGTGVQTPAVGTAGQPSASASAAAAGSTPPPAAPAPPAVPDVAANDIPAAPALPAITGQDGSQQVAAAPPAEAAQGVVLEARMDSWIKVGDANNKTVTNQVLKAGERYVVPDLPGLVLRTGNAGGLDVLVNGQKAPPLGEVGAVLTRISLAPDKLLSGTAVTN